MRRSRFLTVAYETIPTNSWRTTHRVLLALPCQHWTVHLENGVPCAMWTIPVTTRVNRMRKAPHQSIEAAKCCSVGLIPDAINPADQVDHHLLSSRDHARRKPLARLVGQRRQKVLRTGMRWCECGAKVRLGGHKTFYKGQQSDVIGFMDAKNKRQNKQIP